MVCIPCLIVPALLFVWYRFLQPIFLRIWNPFGKIDAPKDEGSHADNDKAVSNGKSCPFSQSNESNAKEEEVTTNVGETLESKKGQYLLLREMEFPDTIEGFGYEFSKDGKLQHIETGSPFEFVVREDDHSYNQKRYEALGELITPQIYNLLEERCGLKRYPVPIDAKENEPTTFIFCSENFQESEKLLILIHGSGVVRAGQWARRLIINDTLNSGTQIPFIERGIEEGYGVLVMNTNDNYRDSRKRIRGSETPETHARYVWKNYVRNCKAEKIAIIAHSYGGVVTTSLYSKYKTDFQERVFAIAMTDSVHFASYDISYLIQIGRNWVTSQLPLDSPVSQRFKDIRCVSAGCLQHEMTSWSSFDSIFRFLREKLLPVSELLGQENTYLSHSISPDEDMPEAREESMDISSVPKTAEEVYEDFTGEVGNEESLPEVGEETKGVESILEAGVEVEEDFTGGGGNELDLPEEERKSKDMDSITETSIEVDDDVRSKRGNELDLLEEEKKSKDVDAITETLIEVDEDGRGKGGNDEDMPKAKKEAMDMNSAHRTDEEYMDEVVNEKDIPEGTDESKDINSIHETTVEADKDGSEGGSQETVKVQEYIAGEKQKNGRPLVPTEEEKHVTSSDMSHGTSNSESQDQLHQETPVLQENFENSSKKLKIDDENL